MKKNVVEKKIMWGDLDSLGIVFYPRYYEWIDACGHLFFESLGITIGDLWQERNILFGLVETSCRYFRPGRYHQEIVIITRIRELDRKSLLLEHLIQDAKDDGLLVKGFEKRICLDVSDPVNFRAADIPDDIYSVLDRAGED
jgi:YbgC/YbaW family acyl-CoA thioester hydrolase